MANNCFWGPVFSGYDISYDYFLFGLYWKEKTGCNDPYEWPLDIIVDNKDLIYCDFHSKLKGEEILERYTGRLPVMHGIKNDEIRRMMIRNFKSEKSATR